VDRILSSAAIFPFSSDPDHCSPIEITHAGQEVIAFSGER
jgi:hypothetical protein